MGNIFFRNTVNPIQSSPENTLGYFSMIRRPSPEITLGYFSMIRPSPENNPVPIQSSPENNLSPIQSSPENNLSPIQSSPEITLVPIQSSPENTLVPIQSSTEITLVSIQLSTNIVGAIGPRIELVDLDDTVIWSRTWLNNTSGIFITGPTGLMVTGPTGYVNNSEKYKIIELLPIENKTIIDSSIDPNDLLCSICHENIKIGLNSIRLTCNHLFHFNCIDKYCKHLKCYKIDCPYCKKKCDINKFDMKFCKIINQNIRLNDIKELTKIWDQISKEHEYNYREIMEKNIELRNNLTEYVHNSKNMFI